MTRQDGYSIDSLVSAHPASAVTPYFVVKDFAYKLNLEEMKALRAKLDASLDGTMYVNQIDDFIKRMENIQVGAVAPDFTLPDVDGNPVTLSGLRGKYVLIDFGLLGVLIAARKIRILLLPGINSRIRILLF